MQTANQINKPGPVPKSASGSLPPVKELLLARIAHADAPALRELCGRELDDTPGLSPADLDELKREIDARFFALTGCGQPGDPVPVKVLRGTSVPFVVGNVVLAAPLERHAALGLVLRRAAKTPADWAHAHAIAEELAHLCGLALAETRADAAGVVGKR